ncbi:uncharacterized protein LOC108670064 isoform X4 [Hyalella azteca]|uniref:Uncharacterized protein LOC108670064 isoform X4 n=1 Tax=Hyalella azteca TaxID=294128 RepID=A0A979FX57_HYAAZ|nr:uncharacterized protein LOC108670064 isoform X4 [Hyalella azteca]
MAGLGAKDILRNVTALEQLIEEINFQRAKEMRQCLMLKEAVHGTTYWTDLFVRHFLFQTDRSTDADDLLFFIRKKHVRGPRHVPKYQTEVEVYRKDSRKLPIGDPDIDWEETVYLNLIIHQFDYTLTLAVCTRTSPKDLQVLKRHSQKVYASPSRRRMDTKGEVEEITYPNVCFHVDNFDEVFCDMQVRDGEMVCVELVAADHSGTRQAVIFLGSIRYDALKRVYDARASLSSKVAQRMMLGLFSGNNSQRIEFVRMKGPAGKGHAEMAVTKPKGSGVETPTSEPGVSLTDLWDQDWDDEPEDRLLYRHQRRLSDPSANFNTFINSGWRARGGGAVGGPDSGGRSRSENEGLDSFADGLYEIESGDVRDASTGCCQCCISSGAEQKGSMAVADETEQFHKVLEELRCSNCGHFHSPDPITLPSRGSTGLEDGSQSLSLEDDKDENAEDDDDILIHVDADPVGLSNSEFCVVTSEITATDALSLTDAILPTNTASSCTNVSRANEGASSSFTSVKISDGVDSSEEAAGPEVGDFQTQNLASIEKISESATCKSSSNEMLECVEIMPEKTLLSTLHPTKYDPLQCPEVIFVDPKGNEKECHRVTELKIGHSKPAVSGDSFKGINPDEPGNLDAIPRLHSISSAKKTPGTAVRIGADTSLSKVDSSRMKRKPPIVKALKCFKGTKVTYRDLPVGENEEADCVANDSDNDCGTGAEEEQPVVADPLLRRIKKTRKTKISMPYKICPDGTHVNFLSDIKLDDGAYNPLWSTRGFTQTFHFWKENRRAQSVPFNAYLTYVTLPWFHIITGEPTSPTSPCRGSTSSLIFWTTRRVPY